jgi:predicted CoA-binding protein
MKEVAMQSPLEAAAEFLAHRRIAVVGVSRNPKDFTRVVFRELARRGYDVVPVNPAVEEAEGRPGFARVQDVRPPPDGAILFTPPALAERVVRDCVEAGVRRVWFHRGAGGGSASPAAVALCAASGVAVVRDLCPYMALPGSQLPHRVHGFFRRLGTRAHPA